MASLLLVFCFIVFFLLASNHVSADRILDDGYKVTTVIDGHKLKLNPHMVLPRPGSSDLIVLDYFGSVFYTVSLPISQNSDFKQFSGDGVIGFSDGAAGSARFNKPKSFTVDLKGNIYVAERNNGAIRMISDSGVTTIAGGYSEGTGHQDGPAQNATFSNDFEVSFVPEICALLISDHGNQLVRQIDLKPENCARGSQSAFGGVSIWVLALGLVFSCVLGMVMGFVIHPHIRSYEGSSPLHCGKTWKLCLINLVKPILMFYSDIRSVVASSRLYGLLRRFICLNLSHLSLLFSINAVGSHASSRRTTYQTSSKGFVSLLDSDVNNLEKSQIPPDELEDLVSLNGPLKLSNSSNEVSKQGDQDDVLLDGRGRIDTMIQANIMEFAKAAEETSPLNGSLVVREGLVKRK
uniref:NHL repeat-containing protein n=1 Tax=Manihot esculenta TaxID=3983 RepID=A0A2C9VUL1_MANES